MGALARCNTNIRLVMTELDALYYYLLSHSHRSMCGTGVTSVTSSVPAVYVQATVLSVLAMAPYGANVLMRKDFCVL